MKIEAGQRTVWWKRRSIMERVLCITTIVSSVLCIISIFTLVLIVSKININSRRLINGGSDKNANVCLTTGCIKAAAEILKSINESVDPCDNFYNFVCGNFLQNAVIEEDASSVSQWSILEKELRRRLLRSLESIGNDPPFYLRNMKIYYASCMNTTDIERLGSEPLNNVLEELGGWPVASLRWESYTFDWMDTLKSIRQMGFNYNLFTGIYVVLDIRNNTRYTISLGQPSFMVDYTFFQEGLDNKILSAYYNLMVDCAVMLGANVDVAKEEMLEVLEFETKIANIIIPREERRNVTALYNKMKIKDLKQLAPEINWNQYLKIILNDDNLSPEQEIIVTVPKYIQKLNELMKFKDKRKQKRILANFMIWKVILENLTYLNKKWRNLEHNFNAALTGRKREADRWRQCLRLISSRFSTAIGSMYSKEYLSLIERDQVTMVAKHVHEAFVKNLENIEWMDNKTRQEARRKAENMLMRIGYPDELLDHNKLSEYYANLRLDESTNFFENDQIFTKWLTNKNFANLKKTYKRGDWENWFGVAVVNAFYYSVANALVMPAGILQDFFFSTEKPNYLNFGSVGSVVGHEITHGFDDKGRQYDYNGNNNNWWESQTETNFLKRAECIVYQYGNYTDPEVGMSVNGINTLGENIADNVAPKLSFWAYKQWVADNGKEPSLPSLKYTPDQLFWISAMMIECGKQRLEELKYNMIVDAHSPFYFRVIGVVSNSKEFSEAFNCPLGSPMNPVNKCVVW